MLRMAMVIVTIGLSGLNFMCVILGCERWFVNGCPDFVYGFLKVG